MKSKLVSISTVVAILLSVSLTIHFYEEQFLKTDGIYNASHDGFFVNDYIIFIDNYTKPIVVNKKTGLGMELGLNMGGQSDEYESLVFKNYTLDESSISEYSYKQNKLSITKYDLNTYKTQKLVKRIRSLLPEERTQKYTNDSTAWGGNSKREFYFNGMYSMISGELYRGRYKVSVKPILFEYYSFDKDEVFYVGNDFNIYKYNKGKTEIVAKDAKTLYLTKKYLYYTDIKSGMTIQLNRGNYLENISYPVDSFTKIRENSENTFILKDRQLLIYKDSELQVSFDNVVGFDIDTEQIYLLDTNNNVDIIDLTTLERKRFWNGT